MKEKRKRERRERERLKPTVVIASFQPTLLAHRHHPFSFFFISGGAVAKRLRAFDIGRLLYTGRSEKPSAKDLNAEFGTQEQSTLTTVNTCLEANRKTVGRLKQEVVVGSTIGYQLSASMCELTHIQRERHRQRGTERVRNRQTDRHTQVASFPSYSFAVLVPIFLHFFSHAVSFSFLFPLLRILPIRS